MGFTTAELRSRVYRMMNEVSSNNRIDASGTTNLDAEMRSVFNDLAIENKTFFYTKAIPIAESQNILSLSQIEPTAVKLGLGTTNNGWADRIQSVQYQRGASGAVTTNTSAGAVVTVTSVAHELEAGNIIYLINTTSYNGRQTVVSAPTVDTFTFAATNSTVAETGTWVLSSAYLRKELAEVGWEQVDKNFISPVKPTATELPQGTLFVTWICAPGDLPASAVVPEYHFPSGQQGLIADVTAKRFMENLADALRTEVLNRIERAEALFKQSMPPPTPEYWGSYKYQNGVYAFRKRTEEALTFYPVT